MAPKRVHAELEHLSTGVKEGRICYCFSLLAINMKARKVEGGVERRLLRGP